MPAPLTEALMYDLVEAIYNVVERTDEHVDTVLGQLDLTRPLSDAVWVLSPHEPAPTMSALAAKLRCERSTATFLVDRLTSKGLARRGSDATDRRRTTVALTPSGIEVRTRLIHAMMTGTPLATLPEQDMHALLGLLHKALVGVPRKYRM